VLSVWPLKVGALYMLRAPHVSGLQPARWPPQARTRARRSASSSSRRMARVRRAVIPHYCARVKLRAAVPSLHSALLRRVRAGDAHAGQRPPRGHVHRRHQAPVPYPRQDAQESVGEHGAAAARVCPRAGPRARGRSPGPARRRATSCWSACATTKMRRRTSSSSAPPWRAARPGRCTARQLVSRVCQRACVLLTGTWRTRRAA